MARVPPLPANESDRLTTLRQLRLADGEREPSLEPLCRLAQTQTGALTAWIGLVDEHEERIHACLGEPPGPFPRATSLAAYAILASTPLVVAEPAGDPRFASWAGQNGHSRWHCLVSCPLLVDEHAVGALTLAFEASPPESALRGLQDLSEMGSALLQARRRLQRARYEMARVRTASQAASDWLWETDESGQVTWTSDNILAHIGGQAIDSIGKRTSEFYRPLEDPDSRASWQRYQEARTRLEPFSGAIAVRDSPRGPITVSISGVPVFDSAGRFKGYRGATRNITRERLAQAAARQAQHLLEQAIESIQAAVMISDADGYIVLSNALWREQFEAFVDPQSPTWENLVRRLAYSGQYPDAVGREEAFVTWRLSLAAEQPKRHELRWNNRWLLTSAQILPSGSTVHLSIDITDRKLAELAHAEQEARLRLSEARLDSVLQAVPDLWFVLDQDGRYRDCPAPQHPMLRRPFDELRGQPCEFDCPPGLGANTRQALVHAHATGQPQRIEYQLTTPDGRLRSFEARLSPMPDGQTLYLTRDLTELRTLKRDVLLMEHVLEAEVSLAILVIDASAPRDATGRPVIYANPAFERLMQIRRADIWGQDWRQVFERAPAGQAGVDELARALEEGRNCTCVIEDRPAVSGQPDAVAETRLNEWHLSPVRDAAGSITHFIAVIRDVTERTRAADKLRLSEELYRSVAAAISDGLVVVTLDGRVAAINPAASRILGVAHDDIIGRGSPFPFTLLGSDMQPLPRERLPVRQVLKGGPAVVDQIAALRRPDASIRWLSIGCHPLCLAPGQAPFSVVATFRDITETREAQQALRQSEERWKFALEGSGAGVWDWNLEANRVYLSRRWKEMLGYTDHEIGDGVADWLGLVHPDDRKRVTQSIQAYLQDRTPSYQSEHRIRHRDGSYRWILDRGKVFSRNERGHPRRLVGTHADITQQRQAEEALREKQAAELASRAKSEFLSRMSHEIRTPLNAVLGFAQLLQLAPDTDQHGEYVEHILRAGQHLLALVNDVLDLQRVEEGRLTLQIQELPLDAVVGHCIELLSPLARQFHVTQANLVAPAQVQADEQRLRQVLLNIGSNGLKYNRSGGQVRWSLEPAPTGRVVLSIEDDGPGITPAQLGRLFQPFERLGKETSNIEGTGLGLIISRMLIEEMGGTLTVHSQPEHGTRVEIELPGLAQGPEVGAQSPAPDTEPMQDTPSSAPATGHDAMRILYVEDNRINALLFEQALKLQAGMELRIAEDGQQALDIAGRWTPDVLVLDAHLPGMSGFEALTALRSVPGLQDTPAFMCSADAMPEDVERARTAGFKGYWTKPIDVHRVLEELKALAQALAASR